MISLHTASRSESIHDALSYPTCWSQPTRQRSAGRGITYKIDPEHEVYRSSGTFQEQLVTAEPWEINLPIKRITPRYL
jgi:hypothetical protein